VGACDADLVGDPLAGVEGTVGYRHELDVWLSKKSRDMAVAGVGAGADEADAECLGCHGRMIPARS